MVLYFHSLAGHSLVLVVCAMCTVASVCYVHCCLFMIICVFVCSLSWPFSFRLSHIFMKYSTYIKHTPFYLVCMWCWNLLVLEFVGASVIFVCAMPVCTVACVGFNRVISR
eukprot:GDKI01040530.1.p3 GENE.GDKI01040530.1~~GDKI01040530.1.p3  ORF type:complete len:111 (-),score=4.75 GDKI01040530.1:494-826(-)